MQILKRVVSLLLIVAMLGSFTLVASAEDTPNTLLELYDSEGQALPTTATIQEGDTFKAVIRTTEARYICELVTAVTYDPGVLECTSSEQMALGFQYPMNNRDTEINENDDTDLAMGTHIAYAQWVSSIRQDIIPADTKWIEYTFKAKKAGTVNMQLRVLEATEILEDGAALQDIKSWFVTQGATVNITAAPVAVETVTLSKDKLSLAQGATEQLTATVLPDDADDKTITWESEDDTIAIVADGLVTGVSEGSTKITATAGSVTATCDVSVAAAGVIPVAGVTISGDNPRSCDISKSATIVAQVTPADATNVGTDDVVWTSSNTDVATVEQAASAPMQGKLTLKSTGQTVITVSVGGYSASVTVNVTKPISSIAISATTAKMATGDKLQLTATVSPTDTTDDATITWSTSAEAVATVEQDGTVTALSEGTAQITAKAGTKSAICTVTVIELGEGTYTVSMPEDQTVSAGETVSLPVNIGSSDKSVTTFNSFDMKFAYDPDALELTTTELADCELILGDGTVRVIRYGAEKALGNAFALQFQAKKKAGATKVTVTSALVGISSSALTDNAKKASLTKVDTTLTIAVKYSVKLPEGMTSDQGTLVDDGSDYIFKVTDEDAEYWNYTVSATMDGQDTTVEDNGDGSYTIKNVTGPLEITSEKTGKTFSVTLTGGDTTGAASASYGTDYTFNIKKDPNYQYDVTVKIAGTDYAGVSGPDDQGNYKISGTDIKGNIEINVAKTWISQDSYQVSVEGTGKDDVTAAEKATKGQDFTFTVKLETGYAYTVGININGSDYTGVTPVDSENGTSKTYTIPGKDVVGTIVLTVDKDRVFNVTWNILKPNEIPERYVTEVTKEKKMGTDYTFTVKNLMKVYKLVVTVKEDGQEKPVTIVTKSSGATRNLHTCTIEKVQGDLEITLSWVVDTDVIKVKVTPFVELDGKTVFMVATRVTDGIAKDSDRIGLKLDTYDGNGMYQDTGTLYADQIEGSAKDRAQTCVWLVTVESGESFTAEDAMQHLTYTNQVGNVSKPADSISGGADVNKSGWIDVNDAQLVYDIYNRLYQSYCMTNKLNGNFLETQTGATMTKFLMADVNKDMKVDVTDAAAVIDQIK